ncbi:MAG: hypothetical protein WC741_04875 [Patescibacteria group bacterium]
MKKLIAILFVFSVFFLVGSVKAGFDQYGYNDTARIFNGTGSGWCQGKLEMDKDYCDDYMGIYANDKIVMKWNSAWDACNENYNEENCLGAWTDNEWNGKKLGGSGEVWHYKIIWVGPGAESSPYWKEGGYSIWGGYEVIMDQGTNSEHIHSILHSIPAGYGVH